MTNPIFRYPAIPSKLFIENRKKLATKLLPNSLVVLHSNDLMPTNADGFMPFRQNNDLFYLSGIDQEETILILYPDAKEKKHQAILFLKKTTPKIAIWEGPKYTKQGAKQCSGIDEIHWLEDFSAILHKLINQAHYVYLSTNEHKGAKTIVKTRNSRFICWCQKNHPLHTYKRLAPIMQDLRIIKSKIEIELIRKACAITEKGFRQMLQLVRPDVAEYELEASLISSFIKQRSRGYAYPPVIASGSRACILHYTHNSLPCKAGEVILLDVGAEYANYGADMTRVVPVNGYFTKRQKQVYKAVLSIMKQAKTLLVPGNNLLTYHNQVGELMQEALVKLGLLNKTTIQKQDPKYPAYKKYFMHGTSHHLGLDTHDVGDIYKPFEPGMVLAIEPGIYIPEENLGIRLENDVVIHQQGVEDLMANIPIEPEEIEELITSPHH